MACLKDHLLLEIANVFCCRFHHEPYKAVPAFLLAGKEPSRVLRQKIGNDVVYVFGTNVKVGYRGASSVKPPFMKILLLKWARKLNVGTPYDWLQDSSRPGLLKVMCENEDVKSLTVSEQSISSWPKLFKMFPKLVSLTLKPPQFDKMLRDAPNELTDLEEIGLDWIDRDVDKVCSLLHEHQGKFPSLEALSIQSLRALKFDAINDNIVLPTIKHFKFKVFQSRLSFNFNLLTATQKVFPNLETLDINVQDYYWDGEDLENVKTFYEVFRSRNFAFSLKMFLRDTLRCSQNEYNAVKNFVATQGTVVQENNYGFWPFLTVKTVLPGKSLIRHLSGEILDYYVSH